jgi:hypothetical protein
VDGFFGFPRASKQARNKEGQGPENRSGPPPIATESKKPMKTTRIISLLAALISLTLATSVSANPASKRIWKGESHVFDNCFSPRHIQQCGYRGMKYVGPHGKGYFVSKWWGRRY